jgi:hypothetical protein
VTKKSAEEMHGMQQEKSRLAQNCARIEQVIYFLIIFDIFFLALMILNNQDIKDKEEEIKIMQRTKEQVHLIQFP